MSIVKMAYRNFRMNLRNYFCLIISLAFTIVILLNFLNIIFTDAFVSLGEQNKSQVNTVISVISFVLGCFMFFFIWYSTNVFLIKRKKEIGIYVFMGLTNERIGRMYMVETLMTGITALVSGILSGTLTTQLFQMILGAISDIEVQLTFRFAAEPLVITSVVFIVMYFAFSVKGYVNIVRSSVLDMISASRQNEHVRIRSWILVCKTVLGVGILSAGYYIAVKEGGMEVINNLLLAVVLVVVGIYLIFGGLIPFLFGCLADSKLFLYKKERTLWINNVTFRMKKNYRTYAMTCVLMLCAVSALATGFAMKERYENMVAFSNTYTFQLLGNEPDMLEEGAELIGKDNDIVYQTQTPLLLVESSLFDTVFEQATYAFLPYSFIRTLAEEAGMEFTLAEPEEDEIISVNKLYFMSFITDRSGRTVTFNDKQYRQIAETSIPYLGKLQERINFYIVNDQEYDRIRSLGLELYICNYKIADTYHFEASMDELAVLTERNTEEHYTGVNVIDPNSNDIEWLKVLYAVAIFMFMVFVLASGSVLFMKLYNDAFEERERYAVLKKLGWDSGILGRAISNELRTAYACPFVLMMISSYFSVHALEKLMTTNLRLINVVSVLVIFVFFALFYLLSVVLYRKNAGSN